MGNSSACAEMLPPQTVEATGSGESASCMGECSDLLTPNDCITPIVPHLKRATPAKLASPTRPDRLTCHVYPPTATPSGFDELQSEWNALLAKSRFDTIFLTYEWQTTWWHYLGHGDLWVLAFRRRDNDELVGIVPIYHFIQEASGDTDDEKSVGAGLRHFTLNGGIEVSDYVDAIMARGWEEEVYKGLLTWLASTDAPEWDVIDLCNIPEESLTYQLFPALAEAAGWHTEVRQEDVAPQFVLPPRYESYLQTYLDKKQRHEIRRKQRRAEQETDVGFYIVDQREHCLEAEIDDFIALQRASRTDKADFMTPEMRRFFNGIAHVLLDAGYLNLSFLTLDGEKAASLMSFEYKGRFLLYNSGYDPDSRAGLSPGWVLLGYAIQYAIASGNWLFDFMQGDEEYKYRFGSQDYQVMRVIVRKLPTA